MSEPVTVVVRRKVKAGREADYEGWLDLLTKGVARDFPGYLGAEFFRPGEDGTYRSVFRFDCVEHLEAFEKSEFRARMLDQGSEFFETDAAWDRMTGLEFWFDPPPGTRLPQPSPHRMALVLVAVVFCLVLGLNLTIGPLVADWPLVARVLLIVAIQVSLMTYIVMPWLTPRIARFIYPEIQTL